MRCGWLFMILVILAFSACEPRERNGEVIDGNDTVIQNDRAMENDMDTEREVTEMEGNESFRNITVEKTGKNSYLVSGEARVYEATVYYVVEDGHYELQEGYTTATNAGPEWGEFQFTMLVEPADQHSTMILYLFQIDAADGTRRDELPIRLPGQHQT